MQPGLDGRHVGRDWQAAYLAGETPWDKGTAHPALVTWLKTNRLRGRILVPGCGSGHDVRALAGDPEAEVIGLDIAPGAREVAGRFPRVGRESYVTGDFLSGRAVASGSMDALFEHTCFCAIPPDRRTEYAMAAAAAVRPGGIFLAIFYKNPGHGGVDGPPFGCSDAELEGLFGRDFEVLGETEGIETFEGREFREVLRVMRRRASQGAD
jgi:SAM-dependent methyltransferase